MRNKKPPHVEVVWGGLNLTTFALYKFSYLKTFST